MAATSFVVYVFLFIFSFICIRIVVISAYSLNQYSGNMLNMSSKKSKAENFIDSVKVKYNLRTDSDVAKLFKISRQALHFWRQQDNVPDKYHRLVENNLIPNVIDLPFGAHSFPAEKGLIPVVGIAEAGTGIDGTDTGGDEFISRPHGLKDANAYAVVVVGDSMKPALKPFTKVIASPNLEVQSGDLAIVRLKDDNVLIAEVRLGKNITLIKYNGSDIHTKKEDVKFMHKIVWTRYR